MSHNTHALEQMFLHIKLYPAVRYIYTRKACSLCVYLPTVRYFATMTFFEEYKSTLVGYLDIIIIIIIQIYFWWSQWKKQSLYCVFILLSMCWNCLQCLVAMTTEGGQQGLLIAVAWFELSPVYGWGQNTTLISIKDHTSTNQNTT